MGVVFLSIIVREQFFRRWSFWYIKPVWKFRLLTRLKSWYIFGLSKLNLCWKFLVWIYVDWKFNTNFYPNLWLIHNQEIIKVLENSRYNFKGIFFYKLIRGKDVKIYNTVQRVQTPKTATAKKLQPPRRQLKPWQMPKTPTNAKQNRLKSQKEQR